MSMANRDWENTFHEVAGTGRLRGDKMKINARSSLLYILGITIGFTIYEALKQAFLPDLSKWESHTLSILVVAVLSTAFILWFQSLWRSQLLRESQLAKELR